MATAMSAPFNGASPHTTAAGSRTPRDLRLLRSLAITGSLLAAPLLVWAEDPPKDALPAQPELPHFATLWENSLFMKLPKEALPSTPEESPDWAASYRISGWLEIGGVTTIYLLNIETSEVTPLELGSSPPEGVAFEAVQMENADSLENLRVQVRHGQHTAWISPPSEDSAVPAPAPTATATSPILANTSGTAPAIPAVTSRLSQTRTPVVLDNSSVKPLPTQATPTAAQPAPTGALGLPTVPVTSPEETAVTRTRLNSIRERSDWSVRNFPRQQ